MRKKVTFNNIVEIKYFTKDEAMKTKTSGINYLYIITPVILLILLSLLL